MRPLQSFYDAARQAEILGKLEELEAAKKQGSAIQTSEQLLEFTRTIGRLERELEALEQGRLSDRLDSETLGRLAEAVQDGQAELTATNSNDKIVSQTGYDETADRAQFEKYKELLGDDAPRDFKDFQALKYDNPTGYDALVGLYSYKGSVPEAPKADFYAYQAVKATGIVGTVRVPPETIEVGKLVFNDAHGTRHGCTLNDVKSYVETAKCTVRRKRWDGVSINFYSLDGAAYISADTMKIKTAFSEKDFDPTTRAIAEVFK